MPESYRTLSDRVLNIDHHPSPDPPVITRTLNPWLHGIDPLPAASYVVYDLLRATLPSAAAWLAALGSILDYCPAAAQELVAREQPQLVRLAELRDTFLAVQYVEPFTTELAALLATLPSPEALLARAPFAARRTAFLARLAHARTAAELRPHAVIARTTADSFRLASPLANRLQDEFPGRLIVVIEHQHDRARFSVRNRAGEPPVGPTLARLADELAVRTGDAADGSGHATAGSARLPAAHDESFLAALLAAFAASA